MHQSVHCLPAHLQSTQQVQMSQFAVTEKESLAQGQLVNTFEKEEPSNDEDKGTFFEILYVPTTDTKLEMEDTLITTFSSTGEERKFSLEEIFVSQCACTCSCTFSITAWKLNLN